MFKEIYHIFDGLLIVLTIGFSPLGSVVKMINKDKRLIEHVRKLWAIPNVVLWHIYAYLEIIPSKDSILIG